VYLKLSLFLEGQTLFLALKIADIFFTPVVNIYYDTYKVTSVFTKNLPYKSLTFAPYFIKNRIHSLKLIA